MRYSTTSAYSSTIHPAMLGCSLPSHPTSTNQLSLRHRFWFHRFSAQIIVQLETETASGLQFFSVADNPGLPHCRRSGLSRRRKDVGVCEIKFHIGRWTSGSAFHSFACFPCAGGVMECVERSGKSAADGERECQGRCENRVLVRGGSAQPPEKRKKREFFRISGWPSAVAHPERYSRRNILCVRSPRE